MFLNEKYSHRIKELAGILLENKNAKLVKLGFTEELATYLNEKADKYSLVLGDWSVRQYAQDHNINKTNLKEILPLIDQNQVIDYLKDNETTVNTIMEWLKFPNREQVDLRQIKTLEEALNVALEWHQNLTATGKINDEMGVVFKVYPEGYYWIDLQTNNSRAEGDAMGHCGRDDRATTLYSLRSRDSKEPHVTIAINEPKKIITQIKGRQNKKPIDKWMKYVFDLLKEKKSKGEFEGFSWSYPVYGADLSQEDMKNIFTPRELFFMKKKEVDQNYGNIWNRRINPQQPEDN